MSKEICEKKFRVKICLDQTPHIDYYFDAFLVENLPVSVNLGMDFLKSHSTQIDLKNHTVSLNNFNIEIPKLGGINTPKKNIENHKNNLEIKPYENLKSDIDIESEIIEKINNLKRDNHEVGLIPNFKHKIVLIEPQKIAPKPIRTPHKNYDILKNSFKEPFNKNIIRRSQSPIAYPCWPRLKKRRLTQTYNRLQGA